MERLDNLKKFIKNKKHRIYRQDLLPDLAEEYSKENLSPIERMTRRFELLCLKENAVVLEDEKIAFLRTIPNLPAIFTSKEWDEIKANHYIHELGFLSNLCPNYKKILSLGLEKLKEGADEYSVRSINALIGLCNRYIAKANEIGNYQVAENISNIIKCGASSFLEALQLFRIIHFALWLEGNYHVTIGSFDRYMLPYFSNDIQNKKITEEEAYEYLVEFFLSFNRDSDLYPGVQQGDNGQSLVLGGLNEQGEDVFNKLSELCLKASSELMLIDPKINIRVSKKTSIDVFKLGTMLTKKGLGFPQYTNDDIAIPALEMLGYTHKDACNYVMAACWELIIPGCGADVANIASLSYAKVIDTCLHRDLPTCKSMDEFIVCVKKEINNECDKIQGRIKNLYFVPSPLMNVCMDFPVINGGKYNNFGIHGSGVCTAADSLCAIEKYVFDNKSLTADQLIKAVDNNFDYCPELLHTLRYETPKVGQNDDYVDKYLVMLVSSFATSLKGRKNCRGGCFRAGTGSAMYYLWDAKEIGASPDGRRKGEALGANFSVSLFAKINGPFSVIQSLTKPNFLYSMNGGPVTLEFSDSMWTDPDSIEKFARFIQAYFKMGGHQIQLNSINIEKLLDAQKHPEKYEHLVVRVWGWSAYFVELDKEYQDHVIQRQRY